ncbi:MAG TPA: hypothetical protein VMK65_10780, partial [Longimicrobiales bacterium]|nr:hypothetical protein [Longimicrobiales bacterium]
RASRGANVLGTLFRSALREIEATDGDAAVQALLSELRTLRQEAAELRRAGDRDGALARMEAARLLVATTIVRELGTEPIGRLLDAVDGKLAAVDARIEALRESGRDVTRLEQRRALVADLVAEARAQDLGSESQAARALLLAARAHAMLSFDKRQGRRGGDGGRAVGWDGRRR